MTDLNVPNADPSATPVPADDFDDAWSSSRNEMPDVSRVGRSQADVDALTDWIVGRVAVDPPRELADGTYPNVLAPIAPAELYVRDDPDGWSDTGARFCMVSGIAFGYLAGNGTVFYRPLPCRQFTHGGCGPERCRQIYESAERAWEGLDEIYVWRADAPTLNQLQTRLGGAETPRGKATSAVRAKHGLHLTIISGSAGGYHAHMFATVDFSTKNRCANPRRCDALPKALALAHLDQLLRGGIIDRDASDKLPLTDRVRVTEPTGAVLFAVGATEHDRNRTRAEIRRHYLADGGTDWPESDDAGWPMQWTNDDLRRYGEEAVAAIKAADKRRAIERASEASACE